MKGLTIHIKDRILRNGIHFSTKKTYRWSYIGFSGRFIGGQSYITEYRYKFIHLKSGNETGITYYVLPPSFHKNPADKFGYTDTLQ